MLLDPKRKWVVMERKPRIFTTNMSASLTIFFLVTLGVSLAFQPHASIIARGPKPSGLAKYDQLERLWQMKKANEPDNYYTVDPDRVRRRLLLFSMLAGVTTSSAVKKAAWALGTDTEEKSVTKNATDLVDIIKPPLDDREYVSYVLQNGLRVLLCSDDSTNEAAAAMDVHVGACSDPKEVPGLAHFNEHMLFLGTKKYPKEDSFESFLSANGGASNAFTDSENTVYYFSMEAEANTKLAEGLDRFGSFFTEPLFTPGATGRELNAIESENAKNLQSDVFRNFQIQKARANAGHPFSKFFTGNKKTLLDDTQANGIDLREKLIQFYNSYYSANQMTLAIVAPQSIDTLRQMVASAFGDIPNKNIDPPENSWKGIPPFTSDDNSVIPSFKHVVEVVPVKDLRQVTVAWPVVYRSKEEYQDSLLIKPTSYVAHLLGHEGPNSLFSYLKRRGWANSLAAASEEELSDFELFAVIVGLTTKGLAAVDDVIEAIYSYISLLQGKPIPSYIYEDLLRLEELQWRFKTKEKPGNYVTSLATSMQKYPPALYVAGPRRLALEDLTGVSSDPRSYFSSKEQLERTRSTVHAYIDRLTVDNSMVTVSSKTFESQADRKEKWYGTNYRVRNIPQNTLDKWYYCAKPNKLKIDYPGQNPFIPLESDLDVKIKPSNRESASRRTFESRMKPISPPIIIRDDGPEGRWTVYYKADDRFGVPKAYLVFQVLTRQVYSTAMRAALATLFEISVSDRLEEYAYDAGLAGLTYDFKVLPRGVRLTFGGYNGKLADFASYVSKKLSKDIRNLLPRNDSDFDRYKDQVMRSLSAFDVKQPYAHAAFYGQLILQPRKFQYSNQDLRDETRKITLPDLLNYVDILLSSGKGIALVQGNVDRDEALTFVKEIGDLLSFKPIPESEYPPRLQALPIPPSDASIVPPRLLIAEPNPFNENAASYVILQSLDESERAHVLIELISALVQQKFYDTLRTQKQLGYIVSSGLRGIGGSRSLSFIVQSSVVSADTATIETIKFLDTVEDEVLGKISKADLSVYIKSLIDRKTEPDNDLATEVTRNWSEISTGRLQFDRIQREAAELLNIEKRDLIEFWRNLYSRDGRRILITEIIPRQGIAASAPPPTSTGYQSSDLYMPALQLGIDDIAQFRRDLEKLIA